MMTKLDFCSILGSFLCFLWYICCCFVGWDIHVLRAAAFLFRFWLRTAKSMFLAQSDQISEFGRILGQILEFGLFSTEKS